MHVVSWSVILLLQKVNCLPANVEFYLLSNWRVGEALSFTLCSFYTFLIYMSISCAYVFTGGVNTPTRRGTKKREYVLIKFYRLFNWSLAITVILWLFLSGSGSKQHVLITLPSLTILSMYIISTFKQSTTNIVL